MHGRHGSGEIPGRARPLSAFGACLVVTLFIRKSDDYRQKDSQTIEFPVTIVPNPEKTIS
jgi:hypothetical protein